MINAPRDGAGRRMARAHRVAVPSWEPCRQGIAIWANARVGRVLQGNTATAALIVHIPSPTVLTRALLTEPVLAARPAVPDSSWLVLLYLLLCIFKFSTFPLLLAHVLFNFTGYS